MPAAPPVAHATLSANLPTRPYVLDITPSSAAPHLLLRHPSSEITIADAQSLQPIDTLRDGHEGHVSCICTDEGAVWSGGKDSRVVRWDERSRRAGNVIKAFVRKPLPVLSLAVSERDNVVIAGTELVSSEAHMLFWDTRNSKEPIYSHSATHSDDITHLSLLPASQTFLHPSSSHPLPSRLLLSSSTDGLVALSDMKESDEEEAVQAAENWGQSIAAAGTYDHKGQMKVWARSDMDGLALWDINKGEEEDIQLQNQTEYPTESFKPQTFIPPHVGPSTARSAVEERQDKSGNLQSDYLIGVVPSIGISKRGVPMIGVGTNDGDIVMLHRSMHNFDPSAYFLSGPGSSRGHKDVVRALYHDIANEAIYTGSEDGVLSGWSLASLPNKLVVGDADIDDDGGDGRDDIKSEDEDEESEIETESDKDEDDEGDGMDVDGDEEEGPRYGPVLGRGAEDRKEKRREKRANPY